ncbi:MAG: hypothetical protein RLY93_11250 [Sumerlaeia bacterium]
MSLRRQRFLSALCVLPLLIAALLQAAPGLCCLARPAAPAHAPAACCQAGEPAHEPAEAPCAEDRSCPRSCCVFTAADPAPTATARVDIASPMDAPMPRAAPLHFDQMVLSSKALEKRGPPSPCSGPSLHLQIQVFLC